jgi:hypothetical protein
MPKNRTRWVVAGVAASFFGFVGAIVVLRATKAITFELALLMLAALLGLYIGFGILIAVYCFMRRLE